MKTSLIIISTLLVLSVFVPFLLFIYNGTKKSISIKKQAKAITKDNGISYNKEEVWRKNFMGISNDNKVLTYAHFKDNSPYIANINLSDLKACHVIKNDTKGKNKMGHLQSLNLQITYKSKTQSDLVINFFDIDEDITEDLEMQRIENWYNLITEAIKPEATQNLVRRAS